jgi:hypothetical protein
LESHDRLALDTPVRQQHGFVRLGFDGLRVERLGLFRVGVVRIGIFVRFGVNQRLMCRRVERHRGLYGRHDGE